MVTPVFLSPHGAPIITAPANPAVASPVTITVPARRLWRISSIAFRLDADANAANRVPLLRFSQGANILHIAVAHDAHIADQNTLYNSAPNLPHHAVAAGVGAFAFSCPQLLAGDTIVVDASLMQVGDQISDIVVSSEEWIIGA